MKISRYSDSQVMDILKQADAGTAVPELCLEHGMISASFYKWRAKYGGMDASMMSRLKELEDENRRLKKMYAEERLKSFRRPWQKSGKAVLRNEVAQQVVSNDGVSIRLACQAFLAAKSVIGISPF